MPPAKHPASKAILDAGRTAATSAGKDFQAEFGDMLGTERQISLTEAVTLGGLDFIGRVHDGLTDARNTAALFRQTSDKGSDEFKRLLRNLEEASRPCTYSIMEVVNFKQFDIAQ